ncbi:MAG: aspartate aminotransferase family protein, partial [Actinobacteria bacterium]|nr:aspartate aminotransferase family protein [Actinomycetota bacterium]
MTDQQEAAARSEQDASARREKNLPEVIAREEAAVLRRQPESTRMAARARQALTGGVTSSWQITVPQPIWLSHGHGSKVYDVDGNEYVDL